MSLFYYFDNGDDLGGDQDTYEEVSSIHNPTVGRSSRVVDLSTPTENESNGWLKLFPELWKAYLRGVGLYQIDNTKVELVGSRQCGCDTMKISTVTCVFKCDIKRNIRVSSCDKCPEFSVPLALMEVHMFPSSAVKPEVAIRIDVMDTHLRQQFIQRQSITSIVKLVENEFPRTMVIDHHLENAYNLIQGDIYPACMYQPTSPLQFALDGNFSLRRLANVPDDSYNSILSHNYHSTNSYWVAEEFPIQPVRRKTNTKTQDHPSCSLFRALSGTKKGNARGLDEIGVFGSTCARHGFPTFFMSMRGGESYLYPMSIINQIIKRCGTNIAIFYDRLLGATDKDVSDAYKRVKENPLLWKKLNERVDIIKNSKAPMMARLFEYDISVLISPQRQEDFYMDIGMTTSDLKDVPLAIPVFHAYSHGPSCQIDYHPRLLPFGLTDAEWA
ncbi:hypothetical protein INT45_005709 [Circinella minor]|uniref:Uncharacterized protein n=1 Tax=Circinella minor TaxID=1195481 RepID=A0A8H7S806_9FUNG|nr:hypothetical protein INT45_005709 [Circinella minor]